MFLKCILVQKVGFLKYKSGLLARLQNEYLAHTGAIFFKLTPSIPLYLQPAQV